MIKKIDTVWSIWSKKNKTRVGDITPTRREAKEEKNFLIKFRKGDKKDLEICKFGITRIIEKKKEK